MLRTEQFASQGIRETDNLSQAQYYEKSRASPEFFSENCNIILSSNTKLPRDLGNTCLKLIPIFYRKKIAFNYFRILRNNKTGIYEKLTFLIRSSWVLSPSPGWNRLHWSGFAITHSCGHYYHAWTCGHCGQFWNGIVSLGNSPCATCDAWAGALGKLQFQSDSSSNRLVRPYSPTKFLTKGVFSPILQLFITWNFQHLFFNYYNKHVTKFFNMWKSD